MLQRQEEAKEGRKQDVPRLLTEGMKLQMECSGGPAGESEQRKDDRLGQLLQEVRERLVEIEGIFQYGKDSEMRYDFAIQDLSHILEIYKDVLAPEKKARMQECQEEFMDKRRAVKNILSVDGIIGHNVARMLSEMETKSWDITRILESEKKHYRLRSPEVESIFEDITGMTIESTDGKLLRVTDTREEYLSRKRKAKAEAEGKEEEQKSGKDDVEKVSKGEDSGTKALTGNNFEKQLKKTVKKKKRRRSRNR